MDQYLETSSQSLRLDENHINSLSKLSLIGTSLVIDSIRKHANELDIVKHSDILDDLGNLKTSDKNLWPQIISQFIEDSQFIPICISDARSIDMALKPMQTLQDYQCAIISDKVIDINRPVSARSYDCYAGIQSHYGQTHHIEENNLIRLSDIRYNHDRAEVRLRDIDIAYIDLASIRYSDNCGHPQSGSAGMTIEEACQVAQYIGASINLKGIIIGPYDANFDRHEITAKNIALLLYYIGEGYRIRLSEIEHDTSTEYNTYTVVPDDLDEELVFVENTTSGRWWIKHIDIENVERLIPCSKEDYEQACSNNISDKLAQVYSLI